MTPQSLSTYRAAFTAFYESLVEVHPEVFSQTGLRRIGSTFRVPGAGGLDAQTFYMRHVLEMVFGDEGVVRDLISLARSAYRGIEPPSEAIENISRVKGLHEVLYRATEAASALTGRIGDWKEGTDLFANILTNTDCALQMAGIYDHTAERRQHGGSANSQTGTLDQSAIDALFS
ncbi:hypothetical protein [Insolitispirillum peregrinum]|uniref:Uncharacterized protein n=1 Tax=Insolitispirillum peregrinum TaxID=80876 RepID=A0A1N7MWJ8_9PROT|nr:hypothetical protein [Insolitispirillum peregrinum]SIS90311.1 hypothetical protein SAMN05421779_104396 [Insolitispirillum peregrinum]